MENMERFGEKDAWQVTAALPISDMVGWNEVNDLIDGIASDYHSAGTGFGYRDFAWDRETEEQAKALLKEIEDGIKRVYGEEGLANCDLNYSITPDRDDLRNGFKLRKLETDQDFEACGLGFLDSDDREELKGAYSIIGDVVEINMMSVEWYDWHNERAKYDLPFAYVVNGRAYREESVECCRDEASGTFAIEESVFEKLM